MIIAELPLDEELRLLDLSSYDILDSAAEDDFDEIVELAEQLCRCPISLITLVDKDRQWFKAKSGLEVSQTSRDVAFCSHVILQDKIMSVEDATKDERFSDNPLVTGDLSIRFYAGAPIVSPGGYNVGTVCIIDNKPRQISKDEERALTILSNQVSKLLELRKKNKMIRQRAQELIAVKSKTINQAIQLREDDKKAISENLHEGFAQTIASSILFLNMAEENATQRVPMLQTVKAQLQDMLREMRSLANTILPVGLNWIPAGELIGEYIENIASTFSFSVRFDIKGGRGEGSSDKALIGIRVIEEWMKVLAEKNDISDVNVTVIHNETELELIIENNGALLSFDEMEKAIFDGFIYHRANAHGGTVDLSAGAGNNILRVILPLTCIKNPATKETFSIQ